MRQTPRRFTAAARVARGRVARCDAETPAAYWCRSAEGSCATAAWVAVVRSARNVVESRKDLLACALRRRRNLGVSVAGSADRFARGQQHGNRLVGWEHPDAGVHSGLALGLRIVGGARCSFLRMDVIPAMLKRNDDCPPGPGMLRWLGPIPGVRRPIRLVRLDDDTQTSDPGSPVNWPDRYDRPNFAATSTPTGWN